MMVETLVGTLAGVVCQPIGFAKLVGFAENMDISRDRINIFGA
jgi:hypothetical protein